MGVDQNGTICNTKSNLLFGDGAASSGSCLASEPYFYTGLERDQDSGLDEAVFRQYSSTSGHWMSPDPYNGSYDTTNPQSLNRSSYVLNNPLTWTDPTGQDYISCDQTNYYVDGVSAGSQNTCFTIASSDPTGAGSGYLWFLGEYGATPLNVIQTSSTLNIAVAPK